LVLLAFLDYGVGRNHNLEPAEKAVNWMLGVGPGLRYAIDSYLSLRVDWGFKLHKGDYDSGDQRIHMAAIASF